MSNAEKLYEIICQFGWPGKTLVGEDGASAAALIAQHAISKPDLQRKFLEQLKLAVTQDEASPVQAACLEDRILFNEGKPQKYGMLFDWSESGELVTNVDDIALANARRRRLGLRTLEEATALHRKQVHEEGGGPPADYHAHKR